METYPWDRIVTVEELDPTLASSFSCGNEQMDNWFLTKALNWSYLGFCQVYIALDSKGIVGFFSLSATSVAPTSLTNKLRHGKNAMEHPGFLLGRIAVREDMQKSGKRVGTMLLDYAVRRAIELSHMVGGRFLILDAKNDELAAWYAHHGFRPFKDNKLRMILPLKDAQLG